MRVITLENKGKHEVMFAQCSESRVITYDPSGNFIHTL